RHQERDQQSTGPKTPFVEALNVGVADVAGGFRVPAPIPGTYLVGELEAALIGGETSYVRNILLTAAGDKETVLSYGGAMRLGIVRTAEEASGRWGDLAITVEAGYASGDAD